MKKILKSIFVILLTILFVTPNALANSKYYTVKYDGTKDLSEAGNGFKRVRVFYDYGSPSIGDNARIFASTINNKKNYSKIRYAPIGVRSFKVIDKTTYGEAESYVNYNPLGVDYLQKGSYAQSTGDELSLTLTVVE